MKKNLLIGCGIFIATTTIALAVSWFIQAGKVKNSIERAIAEFNPAMGSWAADDIQVSGFPTDMVITLTNPKATLYTQQFMPSLYKHLSAGLGNSAGVLAPPTFPNSTVAIALDGTITISVNALSNHFLYQSHGTTSFSTTDGANTISTRIEQDGTTKCSLNFEGSPASFFSRSWDMTALFNKDSDMPFRNFECVVPSYIAVDAYSGKPLFSQEASSWRASFNPQNERNHVALYVNMPGSEIFPAGDESYRKLMPLLLPTEYQLPMHAMSAYGKMSMLLDLEAEGHADDNKITSAPFNINIKEYRFENAFNKSLGHLVLHSTPKDGDIAITIDTSNIAEFSEKQPEYAKLVLADAIEELHNIPTTDQPPSGFVHTMQNRPKEELMEIGLDILPNVSLMGTFTNIIKANFTGNETKRTGKLALSDLQLTSRDFGITGNGTGEMPPGQILPTINANLTCRNCLNMIDTLHGYLNRLERGLLRLEPTLAGQIALQPDMVNWIKFVLGNVGVSNVNSPNDLEFAISGDANNIQINGKSMMEIMALASQPQP